MKSKIHENNKNNKNNKIMSKKSILIMALAIALGTTVSCNKKEETTSPQLITFVNYRCKNCGDIFDEKTEVCISCDEYNSLIEI